MDKTGTNKLRDGEVLSKCNGGRVRGSRFSSSQLFSVLLYYDVVLIFHKFSAFFL